jgi:lipoate-protein ligase B
VSLELKVIDLGRTSYGDAWKLQSETFGRRIKGEVGDTLILAEHNPTISLGMNAEWNKLHFERAKIEELGVSVVNSDRGGGAAYLGPGILVGYPIMDILPYGGVLQFMQRMEDLMIMTAKNFGINVGRHNVMNPTTDKPYRATWYTENGRNCVLCTKGIKAQIQGGGMYTHHGFALNVNREEPTYFHLIDPCGFPSTEVAPISMGEILGRRVDMDEVKGTVVRNFREVFSQNEVPQYA